MCSAPNVFFFPKFDVRRISRNKLHKYLIRERPDETILSQISDGPACVYESTTNGLSTLFLAIAKKKEIVTRKLIEIYENDYKALVDNGYSNGVAVLVAFGCDDIKFTAEKLKKFPSEASGDNGKKKFMVMMKETNEASPTFVSLAPPKTDDEQKAFMAIVERLHKNGTFNVNAANSNGDSAFLVAAHQGLIWVLEKLLEFGASYDVGNKERTPLVAACVGHQLETVKWIYKKLKPDLLKFMTSGVDLFHIATSGAFEVFDYIMTEIQRLDGDEHVEEIFGRRTEYHDCNILMEAINHSQFDFAIKCMKFDPNLSVLDSSNNNLLHLVLRSGLVTPASKELCKLLIKKLPNLLLMEDSNQWTPLHLLATTNCTEEIAEVYQKEPTYKNAFFKGFVDSPTVQKELEKIWTPTPGHFAFVTVVSSGYIKMAEFILDNHPDEFDSAAYISGLVLATDSLTFIERLQKLKFFDMNIPDENKKFPIVGALMQRRFDIYKYMIESCGIKDVNSMLDPVSSHNLLHYAIWKNPVEVAGVPFLECCLPPDVDSSDDESEQQKLGNEFYHVTAFLVSVDKHQMHGN